MIVRQSDRMHQLLDRLVSLRLRLEEAATYYNEESIRPVVCSISVTDTPDEA